MTDYQDIALTKYRVAARAILTCYGPAKELEKRHKLLLEAIEDVKLADKQAGNSKAQKEMANYF